MIDNYKVGNRIKQTRMSRKMTREELAGEAELSTSFLYEIETGKKSFSAYTLDNLSRALGLTADYILHGEELSAEMQNEVSSEELYEIKLRQAQILLERAHREIRELLGR